MKTEFSSGHEPYNGFKEVFSSPDEGQKVLKASWMETPLGPMLIIADDEMVYMVEFIDRKILKKKIERLVQKNRISIIPGKARAAEQIEKELNEYFSGKICDFKTPLHIMGSPFQKKVWKELQKIPGGETRSYAELAAAIGKPSAFRAAALANGANQFAIVIPCHRVINSNGALGGYASGLKKKEWLLKHERK